MQLVIINALLYIAALVVYWRQRKEVDAAFIIILLYTVIALASVLYVINTEDKWHFRLWPFIYLFILFLLFIRPMLINTEQLCKGLRVSNLPAIKGFIIIYVICAAISIYYSSYQAIENFMYGNWDVIRAKLYLGEIELYSNQIERIAKIVVNYSLPIAILIYYYYLASGKVRIIWIFIFTFAITGPLFILSVNTASRGMVLHLFTYHIIGYMLFRRRLPTFAKKYLICIGMLLVLISTVYAIIVTIGRFGEDNSSAALLYYFGHSMLTFNYGISDSIHTYMNGEYMAGWFYDRFGISRFTGDLDLMLGTHFGTAFFTFVGAYILDYGFMGTMLIAIMFPMIIKRILSNKSQYDFGDLYLFAFYFNYLFMGVFVTGRGYALSWGIALGIYITLKSLNSFKSPLRYVHFKSIHTL